MKITLDKSYIILYNSFSDKQLSLSTTKGLKMKTENKQTIPVKNKCRCFIHHPSTEDESREIFNNMVKAKDNNDTHGVFILAMQLLTPCAKTGKSVQFINEKDLLE